jgi:hypothetical protein
MSSEKCSACGGNQTIGCEKLSIYEEFEVSCLQLESMNWLIVVAGDGDKW